jgi:hypothetical protein
MPGKLQIIKVEFRCNRCDPFHCTFTMHLNRFAEEKQPTTKIRNVCPLYQSRDNYAVFNKVGFEMKERKVIDPIVECE